MGVSGLKAFKSKPIMGRVNEIVTLVVVSMVWMKGPTCLSAASCKSHHHISVAKAIKVIWQSRPFGTHQMGHINPLAFAKAMVNVDSSIVILNTILCKTLVIALYRYFELIHPSTNR
jgi:hypothetical protein